MNLAILRDDFAEAVRGLRRAPGFTIVVVLSLAFGVGSSLATWTVMDRVLFRPPGGVGAPEQLRKIKVLRRFRNSPQVNPIGPSYPDYRDFVAAGAGYARFVGYSTSTRQLGEALTPVSVSYVTEDFFSVLRVVPLRGRFFSAEESQPRPPAIEPIVLSAALWRREFGRDSSVIGRSVRLTDRTVTIIGIAQEEFRGLEPNPVDLWAPVGSMLGPGSEGGSFASRDRWGMEFVARLERGEWKELLPRLTVAYHSKDRERIESDSAARVVTAPLLEPFNAGNFGQLYSRNASLTARIVFVSVAVLFVSMIHAAIMLSLRAVRRRRETAIRVALGMPRARIALQHACEAACIAVLSGVGAVLLAWWGAKLLDARLLSTLQPAAVNIDSRLLSVAILLAGAVFATNTIVPWLLSRRIAPTALRTDEIARDSSDAWLREALVGAETAACVAIVMLAGLSVRSLQRVNVADFGFDGARLISYAGPFGTDVGPLRDVVASLPFVESVADGVLSGSGWTRIGIPGRDAIPDSLNPDAGYVGTGYFKTVGARLLAGRTLSDADVAGAPSVMVITNSMARRFWPDESPLGKCVVAFNSCRTIVGVVEDLRWSLGAPSRPRIIMPTAQLGPSPTRLMLIRTRTAALAADAAAIEKLAQPMFLGLNPRPRAIRVVDAMEPQLRPLRAASTLFLLFGAMALLSAAGGVFALISYQLSQRTREIGVRMALGATAVDIARVVARWVAKPFGAGVLAGVIAALAGGRLIGAFLFETASYDVGVLGGVAALVTVAALTAAFGPARRAAKVDPALALRHD